MESYLRLVPYLLRHRARILGAVGVTLVVATATAAYAFLLGPLLKVLLTGASALAGLPLLSRVPPERVLVVLPAALVAAALVRAVAQAAQSYLLGSTGQRIVAEVRRGLYARFLSLPQASLGERHTGDLLSRFSADVQGLELVLTSALASAVRDLLQIAALLGVCAWLDPRLFLLAMAVVPVAGWPLALFTRALKRVSERCQEALGGFTGSVGETVANARVVQAFAREEHELARFDGAQGRYLGLVRGSFLLRAAYSPVVEFVGVLGVAAAIGFAGSAIARGTLTGEALLSFLAALMLLYQPVKSLSLTTGHVLQGMAGARRVFEILDSPARVPEPSEAPRPVFGKELALRGVGFAYGEGAKVLAGLELVLPRGRTVALVGESGSGKSTIASLLLRFWDPLEGRIELDGRDARAFRLAEWRALFAYVPQDPVLFAGTVRDNVGCARPGAGDAEIRAALRAAHAWEFVERMPGGLDAAIGERGSGLSGGERQRIALARALLADRPIIVLDEATSALDAASEALVQAGLDALLADRTALVIAHRLTTVERADHIAVLSGGRVIEQGSHRALLDAGGAYASLWAAQGGPDGSEASRRAGSPASAGRG